MLDDLASFGKTIARRHVVVALFLHFLHLIGGAAMSRISEEGRIFAHYFGFVYAIPRFHSDT